jgi:hypothetical protein
VHEGVNALYWYLEILTDTKKKRSLKKGVYSTFLPASLHGKKIKTTKVMTSYSLSLYPTPLPDSWICPGVDATCRYLETETGSTGQSIAG